MDKSFLVLFFKKEPLACCASGLRRRIALRLSALRGGAVGLVWIVDFILAVTAVEAALVWRRPVLLWNLAAGVGLLLALHVALDGGWFGWVGACLAGAGVAHVGALVSGWSGR